MTITRYCSGCHKAGMKFLPFTDESGNDKAKCKKCGYSVFINAEWETLKKNSPEETKADK